MKKRGRVGLVVGVVEGVIMREWCFLLLMAVAVARVGTRGVERVDKLE